MVRIAVITPTLSANWMLERACRSVEANCGHDLKVDHYIVFDNVMANDFSYKSNANYNQIIIEHTGTRGPSAARNAALKVITKRYDYFGYLDSDDELSDGYLNSAIRELKDKSCALVFGQGVIVPKQTTNCAFSNIPIRAGKISPKLVLVNIIGCPSGVILKNKKIIIEHKFDEEIRYLEDYFYYLDLLNSNVEFIKMKNHYFYQIHEGQATNDKNLTKMDDQFKILFKKLQNMQRSRLAKTIIFCTNKIILLCSSKKTVNFYVFLYGCSYLP